MKVMTRPRDVLDVIPLPRRTIRTVLMRTATNIPVNMVAHILKFLHTTFPLLKRIATKTAKITS